MHLNEQFSCQMVDEPFLPWTKIPSSVALRIREWVSQEDSSDQVHGSLLKGLLRVQAEVSGLFAVADEQTGEGVVHGIETACNHPRVGTACIKRVSTKRTTAATIQKVDHLGAKISP